MALFNITSSPGTVLSFNDYLTHLAVAPDGNIMVYGNFTQVNTKAGTTINHNGIIKITPAGVYDSSFDTTLGVGFGGNFAFLGTGVAIDASNNFFVGGQFTTYNGTAAKNIIKLNADGTINGTFVYGSGISDNYALRPHLLSNGDLVFHGRGTVYNGTTFNRIMKVNPSTGAIDTAYDTNVGSGFNNVPTSVVDTGSGTVVVCGYFTTYNGTGVGHICKINSNGTLDTAFNTNVGTGINNSNANNYSNLVVDGNGKILVGGFFTDYNGNSVGRLVRLNSDGTFDNTFNVGGAGANGTVYYLAVSETNKYLINGAFTTFNGVTVNGSVLLNNDGTIDTAYQPDPVFSIGFEETFRLGGSWYISYNNYIDGRYYILKVEDNGSKIFL